jgi:hypothetical protein
MMAVSRRLEHVGTFPRGGGAVSSDAERPRRYEQSAEPRGYRLPPVRILELKELFGGGIGGGGIGEESNYSSDLAGRMGVSVSSVCPASEYSELVGAERHLDGGALDAFLKLERARRAMSRLTPSTARVLFAAYGPPRVRLRPFTPSYNLKHRLDELPTLVLVTACLLKHRAAMVAELTAARIKRADEAAHASHAAVEGSWGDMVAARCGGTVSNPAHPAQRDVAHMRIRRGTEAEITPQIALEDALYLGPRPPKDVESLRRSFILESTREADELLMDASRLYQSAWRDAQRPS